MNADLSAAMSVLDKETYHVTAEPDETEADTVSEEHYWRWRLQMAEQIAREIDAERFGVVSLHVFGSTKNATAGPASDIDLLLHFRGTPEQLDLALSWLDGWSLCLGEMNYLQTGYKTGGLLDVHIVTDEDIAKNTSWAAKIGQHHCHASGNKKLL